MSEVRRKLLIRINNSEYKGLKFTSTGNSTIRLSNVDGNAPDIKYSLDNGETWTLWNYSSISLSNGQSVIMKGNNPNGFASSNSKYSYFIMTGSLAASGNIMSLIDNGLCLTLIIPCNYCYCRLFIYCTSLTSAPELPATTLAEGCYSYMFSGCSSLTSVPSILPATTLTSGCYRGMFLNCSSLTTAPELPATTLKDYCYYGMFNGCTKLNYIKCLATSGININDSTYNWVNGVASSGTFVKSSSASWPTGNHGTPSNWTIQNV